MDLKGNNRLLMQSENLVIVFAKNIILGKVKTRLAKTIGNQEAFNVYRHLVEITERETTKMEHCDIHVYFSDVSIEGSWPNNVKFVQYGNNLGERMMNAFDESFKSGYKKVIGVGSDLPDLSAEIMTEGLQSLEANDTVFGPSEDGGYYLLGMKKLIPEIFIDKVWSTESLLDVTKSELDELGYSCKLLKVLNDIDTVEDLQNSSIAETFEHVMR